MNYHVCFMFNGEGKPHIVVADDNQFNGFQKEAQPGQGPLFKLEPATRLLHEMYEANCNFTWGPSKRQEEAINQFLKKNSGTIIRYRPDCTEEEFDSFDCGKVPQRGITIKDHWSHKQFFDRVKEIRAEKNNG